MHLSEPFKIDLTFNDLDHFVETVRGWNLDFWQLEQGRFYAKVSQIGCRNYMLGHAKFGRKLHQFGLPPAGGWTFVVPNHRDMQLLWRGQQLGESQLMCFPLNGELESVSHDCFDMLTFSVSEERLARRLEELELPLDLLVGRELCDANPRLILALRLQLGRMHALSADKVIGNQQSLEAELDSLLGYMLSAWAKVSHQPRQALPSAKSQMLFRVAEHIKAHQHGPIPIADLCAHAGVSERTLQYAFKRKFQMTPKQYIQARRLNGVRSAILSRPDTSIGKLASDWGFWHMGQFAADYKRLFGELPSATSKR